MSVEFFLDTNVLVYSFMGDPSDKRARAGELIESALADGRGVVSWQVVQEFLHVALHKFAKSMSTSQAERYLESTLIPLCGIFPSPDLWGEAVRIHRESGYGFYDSLIVAAALQADARILYTEDLQDGRRFDRLTIRDPFRP